MKADTFQNYRIYETNILKHTHTHTRTDTRTHNYWPPAARSAARYIGVLRKRKANTTPGSPGTLAAGTVAAVILATFFSVRSLWFWPASANHCVKCALGVTSCKAITA